MSRVDLVVVDNDSAAFFFQGDRYSRCALSTFQRDSGFPRSVADDWPGLWERDIDAAVNWGTSDTIFFFRGDQYLAYDIASGKTDDGYPRSIAGNWSGLWLEGIDAAVNWGNGKLYFFKGAEYIRYDVAADRADDGYPKKISGSWRGLWERGVDAVVNWGNGKAHFFRGDEYVSYDTINDCADSGYPCPTRERWPFLGQSTRVATPTGGRQEMLALIERWMPTSLSRPSIPPGATQDLLGRAGWTKAQGIASKQDKDAGKQPATSCGDVLRALLVLWRSNFIGAFMIRDFDARGKAPGAKGRGYYIEADGIRSPKPGDILVLRDGVGDSKRGTVGHVGVLVEAGERTWRTADGGGGVLPDQSASVTERSVRVVNGVAILPSPTDGRERQLDGWVDLDKLEQTV